MTEITRYGHPFGLAIGQEWNGLNSRLARNRPISVAGDLSSFEPHLRNTGTLDPWLIESEHFVSRSSRSAQVLPGEERVPVGEGVQTLSFTGIEAPARTVPTKI